MSYCVNCGVELAKSERKCPLCGVEVLNPADPWRDTPDSKPYPSHVERLNSRIDRRYAATFIAVLMLIPALITVFTNIFTAGELSWSLYVLGALLVIFTCALLPLMMKKQNPYICIIVDGAAVTLLLLLIESMGTEKWFIELGLPLTILATLFGLLMVFLLQPSRSPDPLVLAAIGLTAAGAATVLVECILRLHRGVAPWPTWSIYALIPCVVLSVFLLLLNRKARLKSEIKRRFFV